MQISWLRLYFWNCTRTAFLPLKGWFSNVNLFHHQRQSGFCVFGGKVLREISHISEGWLIFFNFELKNNGIYEKFFFWIKKWGFCVAFIYSIFSKHGEIVIFNRVWAHLAHHINHNLKRPDRIGGGFWVMEAGGGSAPLGGSVNFIYLHSACSELALNYFASRDCLSTIFAGCSLNSISCSFWYT